jgi:hypothetical protein
MPKKKPSFERVFRRIIFPIGFQISKVNSIVPHHLGTFYFHLTPFLDLFQGDEPILFLVATKNLLLLFEPINSNRILVSWFSSPCMYKVFFLTLLLEEKTPLKWNLLFEPVQIDTTRRALLLQSR